jgi:hypothetical protein
MPMTNNNDKLDFGSTKSLLQQKFQLYTSSESFWSDLQGKTVPRFLSERRKPYSIISIIGYLR